MATTILCATDFSVNARHAMDWAAYLAHQFRATLHIYHSYHIPVIVNEVTIPMDAVAETQVEHNLQQRVDEEKERIALRYQNLHIKTAIEPGLASEAVKEYAEKIGAGLIVAGITSRNSAGQYFIGSTAVSIANNGQIPVLIVPHDVAIKPFQHIAFAWDKMSTKQMAGMEILNQFIGTYDSSLEVVRVCPKGQDVSACIHEMRELREFENLQHSYSAIEDDNVETGLVHFIERNHIDLLTVVHRHHGFFQRMFTRSHTDKLAYAVKVPLLVLHEK